MFKKASTCTRCGRKLKSAKSKELKLGPVCYQKYLAAQAEIGFEEDQMTIDDYLGVDYDHESIPANDEKQWIEKYRVGI